MIKFNLNIFWLSSILSTLTNFIIAFFLLFKGRGANKLFGAVALSVGVWSLGSSVYSILPYSNYKLALIWYQIAFTGVIFVPVFFAHFSIAFFKLKRQVLIIMIYALALTFLFFNWFNESKYFLGTLEFSFNQFYWMDWVRDKSMVWLFFYISFYWVLLFYSFILLLKHYKNSKGLFRTQLKYFILGSLIGWIGPHGDYLSVFRLDIYPYTNFFIAIYPCVIAYAIIKYRLMDVTIAITRTGIFVLVYTLILGIPFAVASRFREQLTYIIGYKWWTVPMGLMAALATTGPFIYLYIQRKAENRLLREQKRYQDTLRQASAGMTRIRNLNKLLKLIVYIVSRSVKLTHASIYLFDSKINKYILQATRNKDKTSKFDLDYQDELITYLNTNRAPLVYEELKRLADEFKDKDLSSAVGQMKSINSAVIIPSFVEDKLLGFISLGNKISNKIFTEEDLSVFSVLANQAALAIENAQFYEEVQETQEQLYQAEKMATIGTMADGLSHQINNRFNALSLIAGDTLDTLKLMDKNDVSPKTKVTFDQIQKALQKIEDNVKTGGEIVRGLLKYSRPGEEGLELTSLDDVINASLDMAQYKVKLNEIDIVKNYDLSLPKIKMNATQIQEVFFNLIDNAFFAIKLRKDELKEEGFKGEINISAEQLSGKLKIEVSDNGMGVKKDDFEKLFTPFFTTKASSKKGTGLGLFVIQKIITDTHKGRITVTSNYKEGTTFKIELPIG